MGVQDSFQAASLVVKIAFFVALLGNIFSWISFTTTSWYITDVPFNPVVYHGLWRICQSLSCGLLDGSPSPSLGAIQAFAVFGFVTLNVGFFLLVLFVFWGSCKGNSETRLAAAILFFASAVTWLISVIVFGADFYDGYKSSFTDLGFSFALAIVSLIFSLAAGVLLIVDISGRGSVGSK